jgi:hypothetical protein
MIEMAMFKADMTEFWEFTNALLDKNLCKVWPNGSPGFMSLSYVVGDPLGEHDVVAIYTTKYNPEMESGIEYNAQFDGAVIDKYNFYPRVLIAGH